MRTVFSRYHACARRKRSVFKEFGGGYVDMSVDNFVVYVGSTLSSYGLGLIADNYGWEVVFYVLIACAAICCVIALIARFINGNNGRANVEK